MAYKTLKYRVVEFIPKAPNNEKVEFILQTRVWFGWKYAIDFFGYYRWHKTLQECIDSANEFNKYDTLIQYPTIKRICQ